MSNIEFVVILVKTILMKFTCSVDINASRDKVIELFENPDNLQYWQDGFVSMDHLSGTPGTVGAKSKMLYRNNNRDMELIETIKLNDLPHEFVGDYSFKEGANTMRNLFERLPNGETRYTTEVDYYEMNAFMMKLMSWVMPGLFKKQVQKWMNQFKDFVERENNSM